MLSFYHYMYRTLAMYISLILDYLLIKKSEPYATLNRPRFQRNDSPKLDTVYYIIFFVNPFSSLSGIQIHTFSGLMT